MYLPKKIFLGLKSSETSIESILGRCPNLRERGPARQSGNLTYFIFLWNFCFPFLLKIFRDIEKIDFEGMSKI